MHLNYILFHLWCGISQISLNRNLYDNAWRKFHVIENIRQENRFSFYRACFCIRCAKQGALRDHSN